MSNATSATVDRFTSWTVCAHCEVPHTSERPTREFVIADRADGSKNKRTRTPFHPGCIEEANKQLLDGYEWAAA